MTDKTLEVPGHGDDRRAAEPSGDSAPPTVAEAKAHAEVETLVAGARIARLSTAPTMIADDQPPTVAVTPGDRLRPQPGVAPAQIGDRIGEDQRFEIVEQLGAGGMGTVFRAVDRQLDRAVAIKFFIPDHNIPLHELSAMLKQEARATARLNHENIVRIFDLGTWREVPFLVMEHIEGEALSATLRRKRPEVGQVIAVMTDVLHGLEHAHQRGIIHRDLKPSNVFILPDGRAKILDFGVAYFQGSKASDIISRAVAGTDSGSSPRLVGTPAYMAPEQWRGDEQDGRTDLWAASVLLFEMLTGQLPSWGTSIQSILAWLISKEPAPSPRALRPELPREADALVARGMTKDPAERYQSAREMLDALEAFGRVAEDPSAARGDEAGAASGPERRQLTVVSASLHGVDSLSAEAELDPEEVTELVRNFHRLCADSIQEHGGCVATSVGGHLIACFGYPAAQEDDARRAVRAGLQITQRIAYLEPRIAGVTPHVKVGVHAGLVVVEGLAGGLQRGVPAIQGDAPDLAARVGALAEPNRVAISHPTLALVPGLFATEPLSRPPSSPGGVPRGFATYQVAREIQLASRFEQVFSAELTPLVGRDSEADLLRALWDEAKAGRGQIALLSGDAGIGKSRLVQELRERATAEGHIRMTCQCWPQFRMSAFHPVIQLLLRSAEVEPEDAPAEKLAKVERALASLGFSLPEAVPLFASLLSIELAPPYEPPALTPERQKAKTLEALVSLLKRMAVQSPLLFIVEDLHWIDHSTEELLDLLRAQIDGDRIFALLTCRPEYQPSWPERPNARKLELDRLSPALAAAMVERAAQGRELAPEVVQDLVVRTDGIPLFVEELTKMVVDAMGARRQPLRALTIPTTLNELLLARLDRLPRAGKEVAQLGSVLGRDFTYVLLRGVSSMDEADLQAGLSALTDAGIFFSHGRLPDTKYMFKHALIQEAAYQSLLKSRRQQLHLSVAAALLKYVPGVAETQPELLAHHYGEGGDVEQAIAYWERAGQRATQRSANNEAINHFTRALALLKTRPEGPETLQRELGLSIALGSPVMAIKGYAAPEVEQLYGRAREICQKLGESTQLFPAMAGLWQFYMVGGRIRTSRELGDQLLALAKGANNATLLVLAHRALATSLFLHGELDACVDHTEKGLALYDAHKHGSLAFRHGHDPGVAHCLYAAWALALLGRLDQAQESATRAIDLGRKLGHPLSLSFALSYAAMIHQLRGEPALALEKAESSLVISNEHRFALWLAWATIQRGAALAEMGRSEEGIALMKQGSDGWLRTGARSGMTYITALIAEASAREGRFDEARRDVDQAIATGDAIEEHFNDGELLRLKGDLAIAGGLGGGAAEEAERLYARGLELARQKEARWHELRLSISLGRLMHATGRTAEARCLVERSLAWFNQGLTSVPLARARAALDAWRNT